MLMPPWRQLLMLKKTGSLYRRPDDIGRLLSSCAIYPQFAGPMQSRQRDSGTDRLAQISSSVPDPP
jgi:hypothetical protein